MSHLNLIQFEPANPASMTPVKIAKRPRLLWADRNLLGCMAPAGMAATIVSSMAWVFISW
jgi:hypothetical protein